MDAVEADQPRLIRGVLAGLTGGLVASWVMNEFLSGAKKVSEAVETDDERLAAQRQPQGEDATQKVAGAVIEAVTGEKPSREAKQTGGPIVHYVFGTLMGGMYGGIAEYSPAARMGVGSAFGSALFVGADEVMVPLLGLGKKPTEEPVSGQVQHWLAHVVYGATVELVRRGVRRLL
jgi:putative membrane protein